MVDTPALEPGVLWHGSSNLSSGTNIAVVELVDTSDLKSDAQKHSSSILDSDTTESKLVRY